MPVVLVHGNPECDAIWHRLIAELGVRGVDDVVTLSPPGFGAPVPSQWGATAPEYGAWIIEQLSAIDGPIDLVGHDWGAGHCFWAAAHAPQLLRSLATDVTGLIHPDYVWHDAAQTWITPGAGEELIAAMFGAPKEFLVGRYLQMGLDETAASSIIDATGDEMGRCILALYRSADMGYRTALMAALESSDLPPWLVIDPGADPYVSADLGRGVAERLGLDTTTLGEFGHWWMIEGVAEAADALIDFWSRT